MHVHELSVRELKSVRAQISARELLYGFTLSCVLLYQGVLKHLCKFRIRGLKLSNI